MFVLVTYDVKTDSPMGRKRLRNVAKTCEDFGLRVQDSVFECLLDPAQYAFLRQSLLTLIDPDEDRLTFYNLGSGWQSRIERFGVEPGLTHGELMMI
jgi:CRISPR-associated protein Cas2